MIGVRLRPPLLMAMQYDGRNQVEVDLFVQCECERDGDVLINHTLGGGHRIHVDDWLVSEAHAVVAYGPDKFKAKYELS